MPNNLVLEFPLLSLDGISRFLTFYCTLGWYTLITAGYSKASSAKNIL